MSGFIYVLEVNDFVKIGSTKYPKNRLESYKTLYIPINNIPLQFKKLYKVKENCYDIDDKLKKDYKRGFIRLSETIEFSNAGTEIYKLNNNIDLESWFIINNIEFEEYDIRLCEYNYNEHEQELNILRKKQAHFINLKGYQNDVYDRVVKYLETNKRCSLDIFCGGGKTIIYQKYIMDYYLKYSFIVVLAPTLNLLNDMKDRWRRIRQLTNLEIFEISCKGDTDINAIKLFMSKNRGLIFSTYASIEQIITPLKDVKDCLMIFDECHKCCNNNIMDNILYKLKPRDENIKNYIFATATPKFSDNENLMGMNCKEYFGEIICNITLSRLINEGFLSKYKIIVEKHTSRINNNNNSYNSSINLLIKYLSNKSLSKILLYTKDINNVEWFYNQIKNIEFFKDINVYKAHSKMSIKDIDFVKKDFIESVKPAILINCKLFTEGINIPELEAVVFCDPKNSYTEIIQCFGRPLRTNPNDLNKVAKIFIPISEFDEQNKYYKMLNIIKVIATQDPKLRDELIFMIKNKSDKKPKAVGSILQLSINDIDYTELKLNIEKVLITSLYDAVLYVLRDHIPRTTYKIHQEITDKQLFPNCDDEKNCYEACIQLLENKKVLLNGNELYIPFNTKMSLNAFINELKNKGIETESDYRKSYAPYSEDFPVFPEDLYNGFSWDLLMQAYEYYTYEECCKKIKDLVPQFSKEYKGITDLDKNKLLNKLDNKIPKHLSRFYKKKLSEINSEIFDNII